MAEHVRSAAGECDRRRSAQPGERETIGSVAIRALTEDSVEMDFLTDDPVAQAVTYQRVTFDARAPRCGRYVCATAGRVNWT
jgi:hypothetical protein